MLLVKTWSENTKEGINYLKYNGYGFPVRLLKTDYYLCFGSKRAVVLNDVIVIR